MSLLVLLVSAEQCRPVWMYFKCWSKWRFLERQIFWWLDMVYRA